jgi:hypothetical protein
MSNPATSSTLLEKLLGIDKDRKNKYLLKEINKLLNENKNMKIAITMLLNDLPSNKDWLDPVLEKQLKEYRLGK